jgi:hypothetical protein
LEWAGQQFHLVTMRSRALKIDALLGQERWLAASEKPAMPHTGFIK